MTEYICERMSELCKQTITKQVHGAPCEYHYNPLNLEDPRLPLAWRIFLLKTRECGTCGHLKGFKHAIKEDIAAGRIPADAVKWRV